MLLLLLLTYLVSHKHKYTLAEQQLCTVDDTTCSSGPYGQDLSDCHLSLAVRNHNQDISGKQIRKLGVFVNRPIARGVPLPPSIKSEITGDLVHHLIDVPENSTSQLEKWLSHGYLIDARTSGYGGNYEGNGRVLTVLPGLGMLASSFVLEDNAAQETVGNTTGLATRGPSAWASIPTTDEANHPRRYSPLAGSFALNYNLTFRAAQPLSFGEEVTVDRSGWFRRNSLKGAYEKTVDDTIHTSGICLDSNIYPSFAKKGRGAFASKSINKGSVVAYSPVLPLPREELQYLRKKDRKKINAVLRDQLLLNYCFGHSNSSVLLYPYGFYVNYINHAPSETQTRSTDEYLTANVRVQWSEKLNSDSSEVSLRAMSPNDLWKRPSPEGLVLEYIALRNIQPNEEILLDYGSAWSKAWEAHTKQWKEDPLNNDGGIDAMTQSKNTDYSPAYIMDDVVSNLRTAEEQLTYPYEGNVFTACFYRYEQPETFNEIKSSTKILNEATPWKMSRGLFDMTNLRPCKVISRAPAVDRHTGEQQHGGQNFYTAIIQNRPGLPENERIPKGVKHVVSGIPREAFRFIDRPYSSDEHLDGAFRHHIGLEEPGIYPDAWFDLK